MVRLPPTAAMRAFEASARHLSFTKAARELHITQSAVSHQIRHIENMWGFKLFGRRGRRLVLTEEGQRVIPIIRDFLEHLTRALQELGNRSDRGSLRVSLLQSFAFKWLVPRLGDFNRLHPEIHVWISTGEQLVDFSDEDVDVAIRLGRGEWPQLHCEPLLQEYVFPVCSPRLLENWPAPDEPERLLNYPLIYRHSYDICPRWRDWFNDAGVEVKSLPRGSRFPETSMAIQAAIDDLGIALARSAHVEGDLANGRLVKLLNVHSVSNVSYFVVCQKGRQQEPLISTFIAWLQIEAEKSQIAFDKVVGNPYSS